MMGKTPFSGSTNGLIALLLKRLPRPIQYSIAPAVRSSRSVADALQNSGWLLHIRKPLPISTFKQVLDCSSMESTINFKYSVRHFANLCSFCFVQQFCILLFSLTSMMI